MSKFIDAEKLKAEIDKLYGEYKDKFHQSGDQYHLGLIDGLDMAERVLDTIESEKPMNPDDAMKELDEKIALVKQKKTWDGVDVDKYMDEVRGREPENPMDLEEEIERCVIEPYYDLNGVAVKGATAYLTVNDVADIARHFAEWGYIRAAEKYNEVEYNRQRAEESAPNDLEEAASEYSTNEADRVWGKPDPHDYTDHSGCGAAHDNYEVGLQVGFKAGAKWQKQQDEKEQADLFTIVALDAAQRAKEQMMKDGLDAVKSGQSNKIEKTIAGVFVKYGMDRQKEMMMKEAVEGDYDCQYCAPAIFLDRNLEGIKDGDKVRVIVCKKED